MTEAVDVRSIAPRLASGGVIDSFLTGETCKVLFARSLEAHGTHAGTLAMDLCAGGHRSIEQALTCGETRFYAPDAGSLYHTFLVMERGKRIFALAVEWGNRPNPKLEAIVDRLFEGRPTPRRDRTPDTAQAHELKAYVLNGHGQVRKLAADVMANAWRDDELFSTMSSIRPFAERDGWSPGNPGLGPSGIDLWREFFAALRDVLRGRCPAGRIEADAAEMAARVWNVGDTRGLEHYEAARELALALGRADEFLPGSACETGLATMYAVQAELDIDKLLGKGYLDRIHAACLARGHLAADTEFEFNDLDDHVYAQERDGTRLLFFRDQNRRTVVEMRGDATTGEVAVRSASADSRRKPAPLARFAVAGGRAAAAEGPGLGGEDLRAWNSFVSVAESADCVLEEEYGATPKP